MLEKERTFKIRKIESYETQLKENKTDLVISVLGLSASLGATFLGKGILSYGSLFIGSIYAISLWRALMKKCKLKEEIISLQNELDEDTIRGR